MKPRLTIVLGCLLAHVLGAPVAAAQASDADQSLTALPWQGAFVRVSSEDRVATLAANLLVPESPVRLRLGASAPLDEDTRRAMFIDDEGNAAAFRLSGYVGYESWWGDITGTQESVLRMCQRIQRLQPGSRLDCAGTPDEIRGRLAALIDGGIPTASASGTDWAIGLQVSGAYDRQDVVLATDITADDEVDKYEVDFRLRLASYTDGLMALQLLVGVDVGQSPRLSSVERCRASPSSNPDVTGRACDRVSVLARDPSVQATFASSLTFTVLAPFLIGDTVRPGLDVGVGIDDADFDTTSRFVLRTTLFASPRVADTFIRFGVGAELSVHMHDDPDAEFAAGDTRFTPYLVVGGSIQP